MYRAAVFALLILAGAAFAAEPLTTELTSPPAQPASRPGQVFEHIDAMYDQQGNLIGADLDDVSMDSLYWKDYYSTTYMKSSDKVTSPSPANRTAMSFHDNQSCPGMTPDGQYVYEAYSTYLYRFSTADGSMTSYNTGYSGSTVCGTDGQFVYRPNGTSIYKFTMTGSYVNTTTVDHSSGQYGFAVANDTVWITSGATYYGYGCDRFTGGSINATATWSTGLSGTVMNVAWDGTYYYISVGGGSSNAFRRYYSNRSLYTSGTVYIDTRSCMAKSPRGLSTDSLYYKTYQVNYLRVSPKVTSPTPANRLALTWQNDQTVPCLTPAGDYTYEVYNWNLRRVNTTTGAVDNYTLAYPGKGSVGTDGQYIYVPNSGSTDINKYTMTGTYVNTSTPAYNCSNYGFAVVNDTVWLTSYTSGTPIWYGYACSKFTGGSINNDATWTTGNCGGSTPMNMAWDGTYYYVLSGGNASSNPFFRYYSNRTLYTSGTITGDQRSVMCRVPDRHDVGVTRILAPSGTYDSGATATPACSVYNYGNVTEASYDVAMMIGSYTGTATITNHAPHAYLYTTFATWTARPRGTTAVSCSTKLSNDSTPSNNKQTGSVTVVVRDAAVTHLLAPTGAYDSTMVVTPSCSVSNYGTAAAQCSVRMKVGSVYNQAIYIDQAAGTRVHYTFPTWTVGTRGTYAATCSTELTGDMKTSNDKSSRTVTVNVPNVGVVALVGPKGTIPPGTVVTPSCTVYNYGSTSPASYVVRCRIGVAYDRTVTVTSHMPGNKRYLTFPTWTTIAGTWVVKCSTELTGDVGPDNNKKFDTLKVTAGGPPPGGGWTAKKSMPAGAKMIKDGGWLAYDAGKAVIFASRGNKQPDFFAYSPSGDSWSARTPWLPGTEGKLPGKSSAGCADGNGNVYATKGNSTAGFHTYSDSGKVWTQKKDVPLGLSNKKCKGGSDITWAYKGQVGSPYLLKGYKNEFYRYDVPGDSWQTLTPAPVGANLKWDKGSWLAWNDSTRKIYAFKAKYMEFYAYNPDTDSWSAALAPMPLAGSAGSKKAKDGCCGVWDDTDIVHLWALKGGGTREFWQYNLATNKWAEAETIPLGSFKKKVKAGADIVAVGTSMYATKGNKSDELWMYTPAAYLFEAPRQDGVLAGRTANGEWRMALSPNPLASGFASLRYSLPKAGAAELSVYSVTGQRVMAQTFAAGRNGIVNLDLRHLANGVYLVKLSSDGLANSQKLVVQR